MIEQIVVSATNILIGPYILTPGSELLTSTMPTSHRPAVNIVHGFHIALPGTMTSHGKARLSSCRPRKTAFKSTADKLNRSSWIRIEKEMRRPQSIRVPVGSCKTNPIGPELVRNRPDIWDRIRLELVFVSVVEFFWLVSDRMSEIPRLGDH